MSGAVRGPLREAGSPPAPEHGGRAGFSMVEVIIAIVVLAIGVVGLGGTTAHIVRQITLADLMSERAAAFQTIIDRMQSLPYDSVRDGADSVGIYALRWRVEPQGAQNKLVTIYTVGPGLGGTAFPTNDPQAVDSFQIRILRR